MKKLDFERMANDLILFLFFLAIDLSAIYFSLQKHISLVKAYEECSNSHTLISKECSYQDDLAFLFLVIGIFLVVAVVLCYLIEGKSLSKSSLIYLKDKSNQLYKWTIKEYSI